MFAKIELPTCRDTLPADCVVVHFVLNHPSMLGTHGLFPQLGVDFLRLQDGHVTFSLPKETKEATFRREKYRETVTLGFSALAPFSSVQPAMWDARMKPVGDMGQWLLERIARLAFGEKKPLPLAFLAEDWRVMRPFLERVFNAMPGAHKNMWERDIIRTLSVHDPLALLATRTGMEMEALRRAWEEEPPAYDFAAFDGRMLLFERLWNSTIPAEG